jgi:hypothetical protein
VRLHQLLAGALVAVSGAFPMAPPEHMHEAEDHGHVHAFIHRHLPAHALLDHAPHHFATLDDDDDPVLTLSAVYTVSAPFVISVPVVSVVTVEPPPSAPVDRGSPHVEILIHGPPRAPNGLRAPPALPTT